LEGNIHIVPNQYETDPIKQRINLNAYYILHSKNPKSDNNPRFVKLRALALYFYNSQVIMPRMIASDEYQAFLDGKGPMPEFLAALSEQDE
jgi:hypothetical protein